VLVILSKFVVHVMPLNLAAHLCLIYLPVFRSTYKAVMLTCIMGTSLVPFNVGFHGDKKCEVVPLRVMNAYGGIGGIASPLILNLSNR
jgi:hypothetical protein